MTEPAPIHAWVAGPADADVRAALERLRLADDVAAIAVMPDVHLASEVCVGVALATRSRLIPAAVGSDIGCGMSALGFDVEARAAAAIGPRLLAGLGAAIPIVRHRARDRPTLPDDLASEALSSPSLERAKLRDGPLQLGSLGRGNHFVELQTDDHGQLWAMVHSGSRGIGQAIRTWHEARAEPDAVGLRGIEAASEAGEAYLHDMGWALRYAARSRERLLARVAELLADALGASARADTAIHCHHNFVRRETHRLGGERDDAREVELWVHRKGAISACAGELGIIPGSMGSASYHVEGRGEPRALCSSSHGAGRALRRGEAMRRISAKQLHRELRGVCFDARLADRLRDEAPGAYKDIGAVMRAQRDLTRIVRRLRPVLAFKGA